MKLIKVIVFILMTKSVFGVANPDPIVIVPFNNVIWCAAGKVSVQFQHCSEKLDSLGLTLSKVTFNMGDGHSIDTVFQAGVAIDPLISLTHEYNSFGVIEISGYSLVKDSLGNEIAHEVYFFSSSSYTLDGICDDFNYYSDTSSVYYKDSIHNINPLLDATFDGQVLSFYNHSTFEPSDLPWASFLGYEIKLENDVVHTGFGFPGGGSPVYQMPIQKSGQYSYEITYNVFGEGFSCSKSYGHYIDIEIKDTCETCSSFYPEPGKRYWLSAWVKVDVSSQVITYDDVSLELNFVNSGQSAVSFTPTGNIIENWQRIVGTFTIPLGTTDLEINLVNDNSGINAYFDDIRVHPFNASMKSYVYDPETLWLTAELDDNNYATFYEYDKEGQLIRIKKETARGVMTIQESRSRQIKEGDITTP